MTQLLNTTLPANVSAAISKIYTCRESSPVSANIQATFVYGSGGTTADYWVQTSCDNGANWTDVINFHFVTTSLRQAYNLSSNTVIATPYVPTDGTLSANSAKDGILGSLWRVKYTLVPHVIDFEFDS